MRWRIHERGLAQAQADMVGACRHVRPAARGHGRVVDAEPRRNRQRRFPLAGGDESRDRNEAILFASRKQMLEAERNYIVGGFGLALAGLLGSLYAARKAGRAG
jgi:hypothetical protein